MPDAASSKMDIISTGRRPHLYSIKRKEGIMYTDTILKLLTHGDRIENHFLIQNKIPCNINYLSF